MTEIWTNLYIKQFPLSWDDARIRDIFSVYGPIANIAISRDAETGKSKGFGFVNMADHESAAKAVQELHNRVFEEEGERLRCCGVLVVGIACHCSNMLTVCGKGL